MKFSPSMVSVHVGDRVIFKNADLVPHTATAKAPATFDSAALKNGDEWTFTAEQTGAIRYVCTFHPMMEGSIVVQSR
jgi:plastocyanin